MAYISRFADYQTCVFQGEGEVCGGLWNMRGKCGDGLVCVKPQSYPKQTDYPEGKCRSHPTKRPLLLEEDELEGANSTSTVPSISSTPTTTVTRSTTIQTTTESSDSGNFQQLNSLTYSQWVRRRLQD